MSNRTNGTIEIRLDVSLADFSSDTVREFLSAVAHSLRSEFWGGENDTDDEVHEVTAMIAYPNAGGEIPSVAGEVF
ncbi:hypothetical protein K8O93_01015 [Gordonia bronchialis]|uniref:hypothetical protein n=1 Tax=Gordonia bronchialis TaxID=2054 RepID=UPI001CBD1E13|nr:hypothetical protein [Gordonia bronchialis]UAK38414.1 hypothetical protein K8O93_01015 [Gordonia bronchialis]